MRNLTDPPDPLLEVFETFRVEGFASAYVKCEELVRSGLLPPDELRDRALMGCEEADRWDAKHFQAREILLGDRTDRQKLQAIQRLMGWTYPSKRNPRELLASYAALTRSSGTVTLTIRSGPRAGAVERVKDCPLDPKQAIARLRRAYEAASDDAILQALHTQRLKSRGPLRAIKLPARR